MHDIERKLRDLGERTAEQVRYAEVPRRQIVRRARIRKALVVGVPAVAAVLLAAVIYPTIDGSDRGGFEGMQLAAVAQTTEDAGAARMEVTMAVDFDGEETTTTGRGVVDFASGNAHLVLGETRWATSLEMLVIGDSVFQRTFDDSGDHETKWYEIEIPGDGAAGLGLGNPSDFLASLRGVSDEVTVVGEETLDGVRVTHYRAEPEVSDLQVPEDVQFDSDPTEVWVDEEGRLRKLTLGGSSEGMPGLGSGSMHMTLRLWDFGVPVDLAEPNPDDVTDERPSWAGPAERAFGDSTTTDESASGPDEFGVEELLTVTGDERLSGPHATVIVSEGHVAICIQAVPRATSQSLLVEVHSGETIASVPGNPLETNPYDRGGCTGPELPPELADRLQSDPHDFELRFEREEAPDVVVPLTVTF